MDATFVELTSFQRYRAEYLTDDQFRQLQNMLLMNPEKGDLIPDTGGLRKVRFKGERRNKGTRGGIRVIYYWSLGHRQFILFTLYDKDQNDDLSRQQRDALAEAVLLIRMVQQNPDTLNVLAHL